MEDDSDLEEGEACSSICEGFDPLDDLPYLDERIENALGCFQKDFEGGVISADLLGPKFGGYGSFLSTCKDLPTAPLLRGTPQMSPMTPIVQRHSSSLPGKNAVLNLGSLQSASCKIKSHQENKRDSGSPAIQTSGNVSMKKGNTIMRANDASDHKPIRVRIKMGSEILSRKVAVVHSDLGLDDSPNSPPVNSHDDSRRMLPHISLDIPNESPSSILREMTLVPVPASLLMSPLPDTLLHAMEKPKQETVADNEHVVKVRKELPVLSQNKFSGVLGNGKALSGKKRRVVSSTGAITCEESPSFNEIKKQKKISTGQRARENSTCGLGGASSSNDSSTFKNKLQKDTNKDGESDQEIALKKSNHIKISGGRLKDHALVSLEELKKASPAKSKASVSNNRFGAKPVSGVPFEEAAYIGQNNMGIGLGSEVAPPPASLELDNWVQCDSCETWRLLPFGMKPEQLPDKWSCNMQSWLPGKNHCGLSQEETANAVVSLYKISGSETCNLENGVINLVSGSGQVDLSHQPLTSRPLPNRIKKKSTVKELSKGGLGISLVEAAGSIRSNLQVPVQMNTLKQSVEKHSARQISKAHGLGMLCDFDEDKFGTDQKAKRLREGTACQVSFKNKRENDRQDSESSKKTRDDDGNKLSQKIKSKETHWKLNLERTTADRNTKPSVNGFSTVNIERDAGKKVPAPKMKLDPQSQLTTGGDSLGAKAYDRTIAPAKKKKLMEYEYNYSGNDSKLLAEGESKVSLNKKGKTANVSTAECKEMKSHQRTRMHHADGFQEHRHFDTSCQYFSCGKEPASGIATSSPSKVLGSHKIGRAYPGKIKASPVQSVSSSPTRSSCLKNLASAGESISRKSQNLHLCGAGSRIMNKKTPPYQEGESEIESITHSRNDKQSKHEICDQNSKFDGISCTNQNTTSGQNQLQDYPSESKADPLQSPVSQDNVIKNRAAMKKVSALTHATTDSSCQVANDVLKEANKLRKLADCFKSSDFEREHKESNFKASLKFLYGASLLETCSDSTVLNEKMNHVEAYRTAAKLAESCAHEYETNQEMAAAALAYKCMEVACMRVVYGRSLGANRDWNPLQKMLQMAPKGESPSSSASDIDTFNHQGVVDRSTFSKGGFPHIAGNHLNVARSQQNFVQLLDFTEDVNLAMEASTKSQNAFRAAIVTLEEPQNRDCVSSIKRVINFSFHNVEALIHLVELAMDALSHSTFCGAKY